MKPAMKKIIFRYYEIFIALIILILSLVIGAINPAFFP